MFPASGMRARLGRVDHRLTQLLTEAAVMMKRPRSFISTLILVLALAIGFASIAMDPAPSVAAGLPQVFDPRAGDPSEPSEGFGPDGSLVSPEYLTPTTDDQPRLAGPSQRVDIRLEVLRFFAHIFRLEGR